MSDAAGGGEAVPQTPESARKRRRSSERQSSQTPKKEGEDDVPPAKSPKKEKKTPAKVKEEPKADSESSDDEPLVMKKKSTPKAKPKAKGKAKTPAKGKAKGKTSAKGKAKAKPKKRAREADSDDSDSDDEAPLGGKKKPAKKKAATKKKPAAKKKTDEKKPAKPKKEPEPEEPFFKWWDHKLPDGVRWEVLDHKGPLFSPPYRALPTSVYMKYDGEACPLEPAAEEIAGFYAGMLRREYVTMDVFNKNFMTDWKKHMTQEEKAKILDLSKCDFGKIAAHIDGEAQKRKDAPKVDKEAKKAAEKLIKEEYGYATIDGMRQAVGNFRIEPPGLFQGRGEHPKMGRLKLRLGPEDVSINVSDISKAPKAPEGHKWKEVISDSKVSWLAKWKENIQGNPKYVMFAADSHIKCQKDHEKYEIARELKTKIDHIRGDYEKNLKSNIMVDRQKATALYFIDKLALRAGGEKDTEEEADTVGCCNLRVQHVELVGDKAHPKVKFDFLGKDSIRYENTVDVSPQVWKNIRIFMKAPKKPEDDLFDRLNVPTLNTYLKNFMPGLTAKTFRTYNASVCLQDQLQQTPVDGSVEEKMLAYNRANRQVAVLCNHQRAEPKSHETSMAKMNEDFAGIEKLIKEKTKALKEEKAANGKKSKKYEQLKKQLETLHKRKVSKNIKITDKEENKTIALGTSKLNYLDPRITIQWALTHDVPFNKVYNKTQLKKFRWAVEMIKDAQEKKLPAFVF